MIDQPALARVWKALPAVVITSAVILVVAIVISLPLACLWKDMAGWVQAVGAIIAIVAGLIGIQHQVSEQEREKVEQIEAVGRAAHSLASSAYDIVTDRLASALQPGKLSGLYSLRGLRTTEMVAAMREFEAGALPTTLIAPFIQLRSCVFAINAKISELYAAEDGAEGEAAQSLKGRRYGELASAVRVHGLASAFHTKLDNLAVAHYRATSHPQPVPPAIASYPSLV